MSNVTQSSPLVTEEKLTEFYNDIKPFLGCPAYVTQEGDAEYYSTDEKVIGRWVDGKPLYQKTINFGALPNTSEKKVSSGLSNVYITFIDGFCKRNGGVFPLSQASPTSSQWCVALSYDYTDNTIAIAAGVDRTEFTDCYITLKYTKTTDSASTTIEQKPTHYSTEEQVVGEWIDGKPIYQKTFTGTTTSVTNTDSNLGIINNFETLVNSFGTIELAGGWGVNQHSIPYPNVIEVYVNTSNELIVHKQGDIANSKKFTVTIQYTKTTD